MLLTMSIGNNLRLSFQRVQKYLVKYPVTRGMLSYSIIWPVGNLIQQVIGGANWDTIDWKRCLRFSIYGGLITAPSLYAWIRLSNIMWPQQSLRTAIYKALVEQVSYTPFAMSAFFYSMTYLETFSKAEAFEEMVTKVPPTFKVAILIWPFLQTFNYSLVPEKNRVLFVSCCSLLWTIFLAYMKQLEREKLARQASEKQAKL